MWSDNMLVPNKAAHKTNAERLIDYYYEPEVAAAARRVHQLRLSGRRGAGGDREDRPEPRRKPADLPRPTSGREPTPSAPEPDGRRQRTTEKFAKLIGSVIA